MERTNTVWIIVAVVVGVIVLVLLFGGVGMMGAGMMGGYGYGGYGFFPWWGALMMIFWILVIGGIIALVVWAVRERQPSSIGRARESEALEILKQRYARGEISREEYERMRQDLL